jgi:hypothetical protein
MAVTMKDIQEKIGPTGQAEFVKLVAGKPIVLGIKDVTLESWPMAEPDPETGEIKTLKGLQFLICKENGTVCEKTLRMTAKRFINQIGRDLETKMYLKKNLRLTKFGDKFDTTYEYEWVSP